MLDHLARQASPGSSFSARHTQARRQARTHAHARQLLGSHMKPIPDCYRRATCCNNTHPRSLTPRSYKRANSKRLLDLYHSGVTKGSNSGLAKGRTFPSLMAANRQAESEEIPPPPSVDHENSRPAALNKFETERIHLACKPQPFLDFDLPPCLFLHVQGPSSGTCRNPAAADTADSSRS